MKILITGIGGLIGSRMAQWILDNIEGASVYGIDDFSCGYPENVPLGVTLFKATLGSAHDPQYVPDIFALGFDVVYHFAAYAAEGLSPYISMYNYHNNLLATAEVVNGCLTHGIGRLVFTSSMAVYGEQTPPFSEYLSRLPIDPYGNAKSASENHIQISDKQFGLPWTIIRPHNVYGPGQCIWTPYRNVLGIWMNRTLQGHPMRIYGDGHQMRAFSYIDDCLLPLWKAGTNSHSLREIINLGGTQPRSILDAAKSLCSVIGHGEYEFHEPRHEVKLAWCTWDKSVRLLDYKDTTPFEEGLHRMWWYAQKAWEEYPQRLHQPGFKYEVSQRKGKSLIYSYWRNLPPAN